MKGLYKVLPPFAPDYSGVCSVLFELGGIVVIHDAGGCTGNFTGFDEPRWYGSTSAVFSSGLREIDTVIGDDEKVLKKLEDAVCSLERQFVAIVGTPTTMVIGTDYAALSHILTQRTGIPALMFDTTGMNYYDYGASLAFLEIARRFVKSGPTIVEAGINIIGATPLDMGNGRQVKKLTSLLADSGFKVISCWSMGSNLDEIACSAQARLNIVVSRSGLEAARYMEREYGVPYFAGIPIGRKSTLKFISTIHSMLGLAFESDTQQVSNDPVAGIRNVLVIGEQVMCNAIRDCLRIDLKIAKVTVGSFFGMDQALMEKGDLHFECEDDLTDLTIENHFDVIVADPLYYDLSVSAKKSYFITFPHLAVSSRLHWDSSLDYIGDDGSNYFSRKLKEIKDENQ
ncbi:MAG: oxidoreductase [Proteobacteria bacterium]|nr:oxidoreductase [Pseudomonadota bacterium]